MLPPLWTHPKLQRGQVPHLAHNRKGKNLELFLLEFSMKNTTTHASLIPFSVDRFQINSDNDGRRRSSIRFQNPQSTAVIGSGFPMCC
jgi:hypothetical protein